MVLFRCHIFVQYTSRALEFFLSKDNLFSPHQISFLVELARFSLSHDYFLFQDQFYLETLGTVMGASFAPYFAILFMGFWENMAIWHTNRFSQDLVIYGRYIGNFAERHNFNGILLGVLQ